MRPILVGIDPGSNGVDPLSPAYPSGKRLADLAGLTSSRFLTGFDRVNLFPAPVDTAVAVGNLLPLLRGRRVVALGNTVASSLGISTQPFSWTVHPDGYVAGFLPHPSGLNRWWNEPANVEAAGRFMTSLTKPCIHVEGPDGSGKSTLIQEIVIRTDLRVIPTCGPAKTGDECLERIRDRLSPGIVSDRSSGLISELVYGPVIRGGTLVAEGELWRIVRAVTGSVTFIYCRPRLSDMQPTWREGEDPAHVEAVKKFKAQIAFRYDEVMTEVVRLGGRVIQHDWTRMATTEVLRCAA